MATIQSTTFCSIDLPPSCVEFLPYHPNLFLIGTYELVKSQKKLESTIEADGAPEPAPLKDTGQQRTGSIKLFQTDGEIIKPLHTHATEFAILDLHFSPHDPDVFCTANSTNSISFFRPQPEDPDHGPNVRRLCTLACFPPGALVLALQWHPVSNSTLGVTLSTGAVLLCRIAADLHAVAPTARLLSLTELAPHRDSAWTLAFTPSGAGVLSGGDDAALAFQAGEAEAGAGAERGRAVGGWSSGKLHGAGVTAILPVGDGVCVTGSYDEHVRVLHTPHPGRKSVLAELNLGGGVWRLKAVEELDPAWDGRSCLTFHVLASCMHAGARILCISKSAEPEGQWRIEVRAKFEQHQSMNYGSDFRLGDNGKELMIISTSFYDKLVCLWKFNL